MLRQGGDNMNRPDEQSRSPLVQTSMEPSIQPRSVYLGMEKTSGSTRVVPSSSLCSIGSSSLEKSSDLITRASYPGPSRSCRTTRLQQGIQVKIYYLLYPNTLNKLIGRKNQTDQVVFQKNWNIPSQDSCRLYDHEQRPFIAKRELGMSQFIS